jgi:DNA-binding MarR family transcriptional regulator
MLRNKVVDCLGNGCHGNRMSFYHRDTYTPERSVGYLIRVCNQLGVTVLDRAFAAEGLNTSQWSALMAIEHGIEPTCASLARDMAHDKGAMTRMMDTLEARGWVERTRSCDDRRVVHLSLTDAGRAVTVRCRDLVVDYWNRCLADWPDAEVEQFLAQLQKLRRTLEEIATCA